MVMYPKNDGKRFVYPQETWDAAKCAKLVKRVAKDGLGTKYPFKGYVGDMIGVSQDYNGGCTRGPNGEYDHPDAKWYPGVEYPLPIVAEGYKLVVRPTWGWQLVVVTPAEQMLEQTT